jgi:hypothetical protein
LGEYKVRLTSGNYSETRNFTIKINPNLKGITPEDQKLQFDLAMKIRNKTTAANEAVISIRKIRKQIEDRIANSGDEQLNTSARAFISKITTVEEDLYQVKNQSNQDPLNFPIKLNNRLASLRRSVETGDAKPTNGAYKVFEELSKELEGHLTKLDQLIKNDLSVLNQSFQSKNLKPVTVGKD